MFVADFASPVNLQAIKNAGYVGIVRYVSDYTWKNITPAEFDSALALGLSVTLVCEQGDQPALRGTLGGMHDSTIADQQADACGYDPTSTLYFVAEDPNVLPQSDWPTVVAYFQALTWGTRRLLGAYGSGPLCAHLLALGLVDRTWTVSTWGTPAGNSLIQVVGANNHGLSIDSDQIIEPDYGQTPVPHAPAPIPPPPPTVYPGDNMTKTPISFAVSGGHGWAPSPVPAGNVVTVNVSDENPNTVARYDNVPIFVAKATQPGPNSPNGALIFAGGADGTYGAEVWSE